MGSIAGRFSAGCGAGPLSQGRLIAGAGDTDQLFDHMVEQLGLLGPGGPVVDLLALPAADDQVARLELAQVVGHRGTAHVHHGGEIDHTLLTVAEEPKDPDAAPVPQLFEDIGHKLELGGAGDALQDPLDGLAVVVGQWCIRHRMLPPFFPIIAQVGPGEKSAGKIGAPWRKKEEKIAIPPLTKE